jgi:short-subunit dehydrogenase
MSSTIIFTGANGSLAAPAIRYLLQNYPNYHLILTVRDTSDKDTNTARLRDTIRDFPDAKTSVRQLDLANLSQVKEFSKEISEEVAEEKLP